MVDYEKAGDESEQDRLLRVHRGWRKAGWSPMQFSWWKPDASGLTFFALAGLLLIFVTPVDFALWGYRDDAQLWAYTLPITGRALLWILIPTCLVNSLLFHRLLSRKTPFDGSTSSQILVLRWIVSGVPLLGLSVIPAWQWLQKSRPAWMLLSTETLPVLNFGQSIGPPLLCRWTSRFDESILPVWTINNYFFVLLASQWIQRTAPASPDFYWWPGLVFSITLHLLMFAGMAWHLRSEVMRARSQRLQSLALLFLTACLLPPIPVFSFLIFLLTLLASPTNTAEDTLAHALLRQRGTTRQLPVWLELREKIQRNRRAFSLRKRPTAPRERYQEADNESARHVRLLLRRKTLLLIPDAIAMSLAVPLLAKSWPWTSLMLAAGLSLAGLLALPLPIIGVAILGIRAASPRDADGRQPGFLDQHPFGACLARTAGLFLLGLLAGHAWRSGQMEALEKLFLYAGGAGFAIIGLKAGVQIFSQVLDPEGTTFNERSRPRDLLHQVLSMVGLISASGVVLALAQLGLERRFVIGWLGASLLWGGRLAKVRLPWLLRLPPGQRMAPEWSQGWRLAIAFIRITAVLPLGGLAVPFWVIACRHLKITTWSANSPPLPPAHPARKPDTLARR